MGAFASAEAPIFSLPYEQLLAWTFRSEQPVQQAEHEPTTVLIADNDMTFRRLVALFLDDAEDITVIAEAADGDQALAMCLELIPDVVLLDMDMPAGGIGAVQAIHFQLPTIKIVMLTGSDVSEDIYGVLKAGASGYVVKADFVASLATTIRGMARGVGVILSPSIAGRVLADFGYVQGYDQSKDDGPRE